MRNVDLEVWCCANHACRTTTSRYQTVRVNGMDIILCALCAKKVSPS